MSSTALALVDTQSGVVSTVGAKMQESDLTLLKRTLVQEQKISDQEFAIFVHVCEHTGLNPFHKQIYAISRGGKMTIQVGIDGYRLIAQRTGAYAGNDEPEYDGTTPQGFPEKCVVTVYKIVQGVRCAFTGVARWAEFYPGERMGDMWRKMPHNQLGKCAEAQALRKAFPAELMNTYVTEELQREPAATIEDKGGVSRLANRARSSKAVKQDDDVIDGSFTSADCTCGAPAGKPHLGKCPQAVLSAAAEPAADYCPQCSQSGGQHFDTCPTLALNLDVPTAVVANGHGDS